jgi:hypothetical protein
MPCDLVQSRVCMVGLACGVLVESIVLAASMVGSDVFSQPSNVFLERSELETKLASSFAGRIEVSMFLFALIKYIQGRKWTALRADGNCQHLQTIRANARREAYSVLFLGKRNPRGKIPPLLHFSITACAQI